MIHDGHHRTAALKRLGCISIMGLIFDYSDPRNQGVLTITKLQFRFQKKKS